MSTIVHSHPDGATTFDSHAAVGSTGAMRWLAASAGGREFMERVFAYPGANGVESVRLGKRAEPITVRGVLMASSEAVLTTLKEALAAKANGRTGNLVVRGSRTFKRCVMKAPRFSAHRQGQYFMESFDVEFVSREA